MKPEIRFSWLTLPIPSSVWGVVSLPLWSSFGRSNTPAPPRLPPSAARTAPTVALASTLLRPALTVTPATAGGDARFSAVASILDCSLVTDHACAALPSATAITPDPLSTTRFPDLFNPSPPQLIRELALPSVSPPKLITPKLAATTRACVTHNCWSIAVPDFPERRDEIVSGGRRNWSQSILVEIGG
jgi:hypothetical protein